MRCALITFVALALTYFASGSEALAGGWRLQRGWLRRARAPVYYRTRDVSHATQPSPASTGSEAPTATPAPHHPTARELATNPAYQGLSDKQKCALLGPERCRMAYPLFSDVDPYPACRAWKWDDEDGWDWNWSELNCPWKQCPDCNDD
jgi:hypothetical protein